jgi:hypothetical protein
MAHGATMLWFDQIFFCLFSDLVLKLKVVDPTYPAVGVTVICSADSKTKLPNVNSTGDIISLHRVMVISCNCLISSTSYHHPITTRYSPPTTHDIMLHPCIFVSTSMVNFVMIQLGYVFSEF